MRVRLLFFSATADRAKTRSAELELPPGSRVAELGKVVVDEYPLLKDMRLTYAVNEQYVSTAKVLSDGDEIAVFTPVSGG